MSCAGADGTCERTVEKGGLCAAHRYRKTHGSSKPMAAPVREKARSPIEGMERAAVEYKEELDTATDAEFQRGRERYRFQLRQYLWQYVPRLLRRHRGELEQPGGVEKFLMKYGGKSHPALSKRTLLQSNPKKRNTR